MSRVCVGAAAQPPHHFPIWVGASHAFTCTQECPTVGGRPRWAAAAQPACRKTHTHLDFTMCICKGHVVNRVSTWARHVAGAALGGSGQNTGGQTSSNRSPQSRARANKGRCKPGSTRLRKNWQQELTCCKPAGACRRPAASLCDARRQRHQATQHVELQN